MSIPPSVGTVPPAASEPVRDRAQVLQALNQVMAGDHPVVLRPRRGSEVSRIRMVDAAGGFLVLELVGEAPTAAPLFSSPLVRAVAHLEKVDLLFDLSGLELDSSTKGPGVRAGLPAAMHRIQRRDSMRVPVRATSRGGPLARVVFKEGEPEMLLRVLDLSSGGCGLVVPASAAAALSGAQPASFVLELGDGSALKMLATLKRTAAASAPGSSASAVYLGCEWGEMMPTTRSVLQKHLDLIRKRRRMIAQGG